MRRAIVCHPAKVAIENVLIDQHYWSLKVIDMH